MIVELNDILSRIRSKAGENIDDDTIQLIDDVSDTFANIKKKDDIDWETKFKENDRAWRKKYTDRFFGGGEEIDNTPDPQPVFEEKKILTYDNLFTEEK